MESANGSAHRLAVLCPQGTLTWTQKLTPLDLPISRYRGQPLAAPMTIHVESLAVTPFGPATDFFGIGQFTDLSESEKLNNPGMEPLNAGWNFGNPDGGQFQSSGTSVTVNPDQVFIQRLPKRFSVRLNAAITSGTLMIDGIRGRMLNERMNTPVVQGGPARVSLSPRRWQTIRKTGGPQSTDLSATAAFLQTRSSDVFAVPAGTQPVDVSDLWS
jgi:hypothetical protein